MTTQAQAAICRGHDHPFTIEPVELAELRPDELLVRVVACGICHTDLAVRDAQLPVPLPAVLGHEGAGIVEAVGSAVTAARPGDRVVMSFNSCGECPSCAIDAPTYCYNFFPHNWSGTRADGTPSMTLGGALQTCIGHGRINQCLGKARLVLGRQTQPISFLDRAAGILACRCDEVAGQRHAAQLGGTLHLLIDMDGNARLKAGGFDVTGWSGYGLSP